MKLKVSIVSFLCCHFSLFYAIIKTAGRLAKAVIIDTFKVAKALTSLSVASYFC